MAEGEQVQGAGDVGVEVDPGVLDGLADARARGEVDDGVKWVSGARRFPREEIGNGGAVGDVQLLEVEAGPAVELARRHCFRRTS